MDPTDAEIIAYYLCEAKCHSVVAYGLNATECSSRLFTQKNAIVIESAKCGLEWEMNVSL